VGADNSLLAVIPPLQHRHDFVNRCVGRTLTVEETSPMKRGLKDPSTFVLRVSKDVSVDIEAAAQIKPWRMALSIPGTFRPEVLRS
jgi:hypothetical protein